MDNRRLTGAICAGSITIHATLRTMKLPGNLPGLPKWTLLRADHVGAPRRMPQAMLNRRGLIAAAGGAGAAWIGSYLWFAIAGRGRSRSMFDADTLATVCSEWRYPKTIGKACLAALPASEASKGPLTRIILGDVKAAGEDCGSASALAHVIRDLSRDDFRRGRIVTVDGWMLSLTETRVYALAALLPQSRDIAG